MIADLTSQGARYEDIHHSFAEAFSFLNSDEPAILAVGSHDRGAFIAVVIETVGIGEQKAKLEFHRRNIDIHATLEGHDNIGWRPKALCTAPAGEFDPDNDIGFVQDRPHLWIPVPAASFAIFFPEDAHAPLAGTGQIRKIVLKIVDK